MYVCSHIYVYLHIVLCLETMAKNNVKNNEIKVNKSKKNKRKEGEKGITVLAFILYIVNI